MAQMPTARPVVGWVALRYSARVTYREGGDGVVREGLRDNFVHEYLSRYASRSWHGNTGRVNSLFWVEVGTCHCGVVDDAEPDVFRRARRFTNGT